jgi:xanthine dehydrogenase YagR molybdenum-binding subunit
MDNSVGKPLDRVDGRLKVTGRALYSAEHPVPNAAYAVLAMSTIPKGRITRMDTRAAERAPGVLAILTHENVEKLPTKPAGSSPNRPTSRKLNLLQDDQVLYSNQPVAVAVADTLENATRAAELVRVEYARDPFNVVLENGMAHAYDPGKAGGGNDPADSNRGDVQAGLTQGNARIEHLYVTPVETHNPMEPHATVAVWEGGKLTLYDATQGVFSDRERVATVLGLHPDDVRVVSPFLGGGFGSKGPTWSHVVLCAMAAKHVNRPVKLVMKREQMFGPLGFRGRTYQTVSLAAKSDGSLTAIRHDTIDQTSSFDQFVEACGLQARMLYESPNAASTHRLVKLDMGTPSFMRAPGEAPGNYALEAAMDELSYALKMDPLELRLRNYADQDPEKKKPWSSKSLRECYRLGAEQFGWSRRKQQVRATRDGDWLVGYGMATACYPTRRSEASATATLRADGTALVEAGTQDLGTGTYTVMTQVAADAIGLPPHEVTFRLGDTDFSETPVSGGSQTAASTGSAVKLAGQALREKVVAMAIDDPGSPLHGLGANDVTIDNGLLVSKSAPSKHESLADLMRRQRKDEIEAKGDAKPGQEKDEYSMYAFGATFAEVRVDADLGQIRVAHMVGAYGAGRILNAKTARSQLMGGMVWGIGMALTEHTIIDPKRGRFVNANLAEYHVPVNMDAPPIEVITVHEEDPHVNELGVKGIGEIGITGATAAIANAVYHATGIRVRELPITPDKLLQA